MNRYLAGLAGGIVALAVSAGAFGGERPMSPAELARLALADSSGLALPADLPMEYQWSLPFRGRVEEVWLYDDIALVLVDGKTIYNVRKIDGVPLWAIELSDPPQFKPAVTRDAIYIYIRNNLTAIDRSAGQILWRVEPDFPAASSPSVSEPNIYGAGWDGRMHAIMLDSRERVYFQGKASEETLKAPEYFFRRLWHQTTNSHLTAAPLLHGNMVFYGADNGFVYAMNRDGKERFRLQTQGPIRRSLTAAPGKIYAASMDYNVYCISELTGRADWVFAAGSEITEEVYPDREAEVAVVITRRHGVYGIRDDGLTHAGTPAWHLPDALFLVGVSQTSFYFAMADDRLAAVDKASGRVQWLSMMQGMGRFLANPNEWRAGVEASDYAARYKNSPMRLFMLTRGNQLVCFKEAGDRD